MLVLQDFKFEVFLSTGNEDKRMGLVQGSTWESQPTEDIVIIHIWKSYIKEDLMVGHGNV